MKELLHKNQVLKRLLAGLLTVAMAVTLQPTEVLAADNHMQEQTQNISEDSSGRAQVGGESTGILANPRMVSVESTEILANPRMEAVEGEETSKSMTWDCVWFGSYPQTEITSEDGELYTKLTEASEEEWEKNDITMDGVNYRRMNGYDAVYAAVEDHRNAYFWKNGKEEYHYFRYEPIKWRVLWVEGNDAFLLADGALDCFVYSDQVEGLVWENCNLRSWLNGYSAEKNREGDDYTQENFINRAFSQAEQEAIRTTTVVNEDDIEYGTEAGNDTQDKIYVLSERELTNKSYGFSDGKYINDKARSAWSEFMSDYSIIRGSTYATWHNGYTAEQETYAAKWWTRTPANGTDRVQIVYEMGYLKFDGMPNLLGISVRPVLHLDLTCTEQWAYAGTTNVLKQVKEVAAPDLWSMHEVKIEELPTASAITYGQTLADSTLSGGKVTVNGKVLEGTWRFGDTTPAPTVSDSNTTEYEVCFYPKDWKQYFKRKAKVTITVNKVEFPPNYPTSAEGSEDTTLVLYEGCEKGKTVADVSLENYPDWRWSEASKAAALATSGETIEAIAEYVGSDKDNYKTLTATIKIMVTECKHDFQIVEAKEPTCQIYGTKRYTCSKCGESYCVADTSKPRVDHDYQLNEEESVALTCNTDGVMVYSCKWCGKSYQEFTKHKGHIYQQMESKEATCTKAGYAHCPCANCDYVFELLLPAKGHSYDVKSYKAATCTTAGREEKVCSVCKQEETVILKAMGHDYDTVVTKATCTTAGSERKTCTRSGCGHVEKKVLPALGHNIVDTWTEKAVTCTENGIEVGYCTNCKKQLKTTIPQTGHSYQTIVSPATLKESGYVLTRCRGNCGTTKITGISKIASVKLAATKYVYSGGNRTPAVVVKDSQGNTLKNNIDYTVSYPSDRKDVGSYTVTIKFKENYYGTVKRTFTIVPRAISISKVTAQKKGFQVSWKKQSSQVTGYQIQYSTSSKFTKNATTLKTLRKYKTTSQKLTKLKAKKKYYVRIRTYKTVKVDGKTTKLYASWSKVKKIITKK